MLLEDGLSAAKIMAEEMSRETHKSDTTTADDQPTATDVQEQYKDIMQSGVGGVEAFIRVFCNQMEIP